MRAIVRSMKRMTVFFGLSAVVMLASLAGCGRGFLSMATRDAWRREAEETCLKSGTVKESPVVVRMTSIDGPGVCGATYPLKVAALGEGPVYGYAEEVRPPGSVPGASRTTPRWPLREPSASAPARLEWTPGPPPADTQAAPIAAEPLRVDAPARAAPIDLGPPGVRNAPPPSGDVYERDDFAAPPARSARPLPQAEERVPLAPSAPPVTGSVQATLKPAATLACPMVSQLDRWIAEAVQPAAQRWFGAPVVEIKQISSYSCRGMNGNPNAHISEHAFGNALDVAAFTLADGRTISVKTGWRGVPEEQGFLRDVQGAACGMFTTVLAPGSNVYHYDHIHVDLMRRSSGRHICQPAAVSGDAVAARAAPRGGFADVTGSLRRKARPSAQATSDDDWIEDESNVR